MLRRIIIAKIGQWITRGASDRALVVWLWMIALFLNQRLVLLACAIHSILIPLLILSIAVVRIMPDLGKPHRCITILSKEQGQRRKALKRSGINVIEIVKWIKSRVMRFDPQ